jgi:hypothetical protein
VIDEPGVAFRELASDITTIKACVLEERYRLHAPGYFGRIARRVRVVDPTALVDQLDTATEQGVLTEPEREALLLADIVLTGQRHADHQDVYLLVEVSGGIGPYDVQRAADRAVVLAKLGRPALPVVAGERITDDGSELAQKRGVWQVLDGQTVAPGAA